MTYNIKKDKKTNKDIDYNNSSLRFRLLGLRVMALCMKCHGLLALRTESREEYQRKRFSNQIVTPPI